MIRERSGKDFDALTGPLVVALGLAVALCLNFGFKYAALKRGKEDTYGGFGNETVENMELRI